MILGQSTQTQLDGIVRDTVRKRLLAQVGRGNLRRRLESSNVQVQESIQGGAYASNIGIEILRCKDEDTCTTLAKINLQTWQRSEHL